MQSLQLVFWSMLLVGHTFGNVVQVPSPKKLLDPINKVLLDILPEDLEHILDANQSPQCTNQVNKFLCTFKNLLIPYTRNPDIDSGIIQKVSMYNQRNQNHTLKLWLSYAPEGNISEDIDTVLNYVKLSTSSDQQAISNILMNYAFQDPNEQAIRIVNQDIKDVKMKIRETVGINLTLGLIFDVNKCQRNYRYLSELNIQQINPVMFIPNLNPMITTFYEYLGFGGKTSHCFALARKLNSTIGYTEPIFIPVNSSTGTFRNRFFKHFTVESVVENNHRPNFSQPIVLMYVKLLNHTRLITNRSLDDNWLRRPIPFHRTNLGITIQPQHISSNVSHFVPNILQNFRKILLVLENSEDLSETQKDFRDFVKKIAEEKLNLIRGSLKPNEVYQNSYEGILELHITLQITYIPSNKDVQKHIIDRIWDFRDLGEVIYPNITDTVLFDLFPDKYFIRGKDLYGWENRQEVCNETTEWGKAFHSLMRELDVCQCQRKTNDKKSVKMGFTISKGILHTMEICKEVPEVLEVFEEMFSHADYLVCKSIVHKNAILAGAKKEFQAMIDVLRFCHTMKTAPGFLGKDLYLLVSIRGCNGGYMEYKDIKELVYFWKLVNDWASSEGETVVIDTAFEGPFKNVHQSFGICGWWRIRHYGENDYELKDKQSIALEILDSSKKIHQKPSVPATEKQSALILSILVPSGLLVGVGLTVIIFYYRSKLLLTKREATDFFIGHQSNKNKCTVGVDDGSTIAESRPYNKTKYELRPSSFTIDPTQSLGSGQFGQVFVGAIRRDTVEITVAVKMAKLGGSTRGKSEGFYMALKGLLTEIKILSFLGPHNHIVGLEGAYTSNLRSGEVVLFLEMCELGSLEKFLRSYEINEGSFEETFGDFEMHQEIVSLPACLSENLYQWAGEIVCGMEFMASKKIVHADIATRNMLLTSSKCAKIADFGLSRRIYDYTGYIKKNQEPLPWRWMAPESLRKLVFNEKSDVWAFGVTLWEMYTLGDIPYPGMSWDVNFSELLEDGLRLQVPKYNERDIYSVMLRCWDNNPSTRPTFKELKSILTQTSEQYT